jgi:hypothetical protein
MVTLALILSVLVAQPLVPSVSKPKGECWMYDGKNKVVKVPCGILTGKWNERK